MKNYTMKKLFLTAITFLLITSPDASPITIITTGETHAIIEPVSIGGEILGGIARRSSLIKKLRKEYPDLLLLDGGASFAGGIYDIYSDGDSLDRVRTGLYMEAMSRMRYDAVGVGDEELQYGMDYLMENAVRHGVPFLSANIRKLAPYRLIDHGGVKCAVIGLTTQESFSENAVPIQPPLQALRNTLKKIGNKAECIIVISHLGEALAEAVADSFPAVRLILNAHRKKSAAPYRKRNKTWILQFSYLGAELLVFQFDTKDHSKHTFHTYKLDDAVRDDSEMEPVRKKWNTVRQNGGKLPIDLYVMSHCPYGTQAEDRLMPLMTTHRVQLRIRYILSGKPGALESLHGPEELAENARQAVIQKYWPDEFPAYLSSVNRGGNWEKSAADAGLPLEILKEKTATEGMRLLETDYLITERLGITASPTLYIRNRPYDGPMDSLRLLMEVCRQTEGSQNSFCADVPACLNDSDCRKPGMEGSCFEPGAPESRCVYRKAPVFKLFIITDSTNRFPGDLQNLENQIQEMLPGAQQVRLDVSSEKASGILKQNGVRKIPALLFEKKAMDSRHFEKVRPTLRETDNYYVFTETRNLNPALWEREKKPGQLEFFWSPMSPVANQILERFLNLAQTRKLNLNKSVFTPIIFLKDGQITTPNGKPELEEIMRTAAVPEKKFVQYLRVRAKNPNTTYWDDHLKAVKLKPRKIKKKAKSRKVKEAVKKSAEKIRDLGNPAAPAYFLLENRQIITVRNEQEMFRLLDLVK